MLARLSMILACVSLVLGCNQTARDNLSSSPSTTPSEPDATIPTNDPVEPTSETESKPEKPERAANLITDPSLESTPVGKLPSAWSRYIDTEKAYQYGVAEGGRTGKQSLMISGQGTRIHAFANGIPLDRSKRYVLRGWVKYEGDVDGSATIKFNYRKGGINYHVDDGDRISVGRDDWQFLTKTDRADEVPDATMLWVSCKLEGNGKASFDDLELIAYNRSELPANFDEQHGKHNRMTGLLDFDRWIGRWTSTTEYKPTATSKGTTTKGETTVRKVLDDQFLLWQWANEAGDSQYMAILGFDEHVRGYHLWLFGSGGETYERIGQWDAASQILKLKVKPPAPGITGISTDRFIDDDRIESTLLVKNADGQVTRDMRATWVRKSATADKEISLSTGPAAKPVQLAVLHKLAGNWTVRQVMKPSVSVPDGDTATITERTEWVLDGRFLMLRGYDGDQKLLSLAVMTWDEKQESFHYWHFSPGVYGGQWRVAWDDTSKEFSWRATNMPPGWIGTGLNRWIDDDNFENQALIKDDQGRVLLDLQQQKKRGD